MRLPSYRIIRSYPYALLYLAFAAILCSKAISYHHPEYGFNWMPLFGEKLSGRELPRLKQADRYILPQSHGYDGQFYAQMALYPNPFQEEIKATGEYYNHYRTRRYALSWLAWLFGLGDPTASLTAYSLLNAFFWAATAVLLLRWLPPISLQNTLRYAACLSCIGWVASWDRALLDGPSAFLTALAVYWVERKRNWMAAAILACNGMVKETNLLSCLALPFPALKRKPILRYGAQIALAVLPIFAWIAALHVFSPVAEVEKSMAGKGNFDWPFFAMARAFADGLSSFSSETFFTAKSVLVVALFIQWISLFASKQRQNPWWRIGIGFAILGCLLGNAVWEGGWSSAAFRVLIPLTFAFNILFPRSTKLLPILLFANIPSVAGFLHLKPSFPNDPQYYFHALPEEPPVTVIPGTQWDTYTNALQQTELRCVGEGTIQIINASESYQAIALHFSNRSTLPLEASINGYPFKSLAPSSQDTPFHLMRFVVAPGSSSIRFTPPSPDAPIHLDAFRLLECQTVSDQELSKSLNYLDFQEGWYDLESDGARKWRWANQSASFNILNTSGQPLPVELGFALRSLNADQISLSGNGQPLSSVALAADQWQNVSLPITLAPGSTSFTLSSAAPGTLVPGDTRPLFFCFRDWNIELTSPRKE